jgi:Plasmid pRiA4b ORF-3-like protein
LLDEKSMLVVEQWASHLLGSIWSAAWASEEADPEDFLEAQVEALVEHMVAEGGPAALSVLRALAVVGEDWVRELADEAGDVLAAGGVPEPVWRGGEDARLVSGYAMSDPFGEVELVVLGFDRDGAQHALLGLVAHVAGSHIAKIMVGEVDVGGIDAMVEELRGEAPFNDPVALTGAQARARLEGPLACLLDDGPQEDGPLDEMFDGVDGDPALWWALLRARLDTLPDDLVTDDDLDDGGDGGQTAAAFLASSYAGGLPDRELARVWAQMAGDWALDSTGAAHRYGPLSLGFFLMAEVGQHVVIDQADLALLPEIVRAWAHFTVEAGRLGPQVHQLWDEQLPVLLSGFAAAYADVESVTHRGDCPEAYDLREYETQAGAQGLLERLYEAMPATMRRQLEAATTTAYPALAPVPDEATGTVHQIKVMLRGSRPPIWRRLLVASTITLTGLHEVIQAAFGWGDGHLWVFTAGHGRFGPTPDLDHQDPDKARLAQIADEGVKFGYLFDFGDHWDHEITVEKVLPVEDGTSYPVCVGGRQPDPVQYGYDDNDDLRGQIFDKNLINTRLARLSTGA